ncbi:MAG TPA: hypothetical protein VE989_03405 [Sphingomicrobium sp.]|jgi:hypothetical protein|nr:hypothetical protein [Sphingomicrobium sp.]
MTTLNPHADPQPDPALALRLEQYAVSHRATASPATAAELDRYDIAVVLQAIYEWGGYRYSNASDAIAAAKRSPK